MRHAIKYSVPEGFKVIPGYTRYCASASGQIMSLVSGKVLKPSPTSSTGQLVVGVACDVPRNTNAQYVHILVALAWIDGYQTGAGLYITHKDGNRTNNAYTNLNVMSQEEFTKLIQRRKLTEQDFEFCKQKWVSLKFPMTPAMLKQIKSEYGPSSKTIEMLSEKYRLPEFTIKRICTGWYDWALDGMTIKQLAAKYGICPKYLANLLYEHHIHARKGSTSRNKGEQ